MAVCVKDGDALVQVEVEKGICSCGVTLCAHLGYVRMISSGSKAPLFIFLSAMHKYIRMGSTKEALHFAGLVASKYNPAIIQRYVLKIFFEESRQTNLFLNLGSSWWEDVTILSAAKKKWTRTQLFPQIVKKAESYINALNDPNPPASAERFLSHDNFYGALADVFRMRIARYTKAQKRRLAKQLFPYLSGLPSQKAFLKMDFNLPSYLWFTALEEYYALSPLEEGTTTIESEIPTDDGYYLIPPLATYDNHTYSGLRVMKNNWHSIAPQMPMPKGLDLRFSGCVIAVGWREFSFQQYGEGFVHVPWEAVDIDAYHWKLTKKLDSMYYGSFYERVEPSILLWGGRSDLD